MTMTTMTNMTTTTPIPTAPLPTPTPTVQRLRQLTQFVRTPKGSVLIALALLAVVAGVGTRQGDGLLPVLGMMLGAALLDVTLGRVMRHAWFFPSGALVTGLIVALVLDPHERWYILAGAVGIAVASKYLVRARRGHIFNPATLGLVAVSLLFGSEQSWWGALPDLAVPVLLALFLAGYVIGDRVNKLPTVLVFAGTYVVICTAVALLGQPARVAEMFRPPYINAMLFFAFFMLTDPPTSPSRYRDQIWYGLIVGIVSIAVYLAFGGLTYLLIGLLVGNVWEAARRTAAGRTRKAIPAI